MRWWEWNRDRPDYREFAGQKCTIENTGGLVTDADVHMLHNDGIEGLSDKPNALRTGVNSGYQALGLAIAAGAARVVLLGYDMHFPGGKSHWHGDHPVKVDERLYRDVFTKAFRSLRTDAEILNATPGSALRCFPEVSLESLVPDPE